MAFLVQAPITNLFLGTPFHSFSQLMPQGLIFGARKLDILAIFLAFLPAAIVRKKPTTRCRIRNDEGDHFRSLFLMSLVDWDAISGDG